MDIVITTQEEIDELCKELKNGSKQSTEDGSQKCSDKKQTPKSKVKKEITSKEFWNAAESISGIDKEGKVYLKLAGTGLSGEQLVINMEQNKDIKFFYGTGAQKQEVTDKDRFLIKMSGDNVSIELNAEFRIK